MAHTYIENARRWAGELEIDYFTYFIKAWIPFNAWFQNSYDENAERTILNNIKGNDNALRAAILRLLENNDDDAVSFRGHIGQLHAELERREIKNRGERLTFTNCFIGDNPCKNLSEKGFGGITYTVERGVLRAANAREVVCEILSNRGSQKFLWRQATYNETELMEQAAFQRCDREQQSEFLTRYRRVNPRLFVDLQDTANNKVRPLLGLARRSQGPATILMGSYPFCDNPEFIFSALIETLYALRCLLFHGEIVPTQEHKSVYEPAYHLLKRFIKCIV